jgi:hypothetical protein
MQQDQGLYRDFNKLSDGIDVTGLKSGDNLLSASSLYVDGTNIYVADPSQKRVVVLIKDVKDIPLIAQFVYRGNAADGFSDCKKIVADAAAEKIFLLDNSKVYVMNMNKLLEFTN